MRLSDWEDHTAFLWKGYNDTIGDGGVRMYLEVVAARYIEDGSCKVIRASWERLELIRERTEDHQKDITNVLGAGAHLGETEALVGKLTFILELLYDLEEVARLGGWDMFIDKYSDGHLRYQREFA